MLDADCQDSHCLFFWLESRVKHASRKCVLFRHRLLSHATETIVPSPRPESSFILRLLKHSSNKKKLEMF